MQFHQAIIINVNLQGVLCQHAIWMSYLLATIAFCNLSTISCSLHKKCVFIWQLVWENIYISISEISEFGFRSIMVEFSFGFVYLSFVNENLDRYGTISLVIACYRYVIFNFKISLSVCNNAADSKRIQPHHQWFMILSPSV